MNKTEINELTVFCENVRFLRKKYGYSKERMAKVCGVNKQTLTKIEQMIMPPRLRINVIFNICWHFRLQPYQLFRTLEFPKK